DLLGRQWHPPLGAFREISAQSSALQVIKDEVLGAFDNAPVVEGNDTVVGPSPCQGVRFTLCSLRIKPRCFRLDQRQGYPAWKKSVLCQVCLLAFTLAEQADDLIAASEHRPRLKDQVLSLTHHALPWGGQSAQAANSFSASLGCTAGKDKDEPP